jgi:hypothetical protein
MFDTGFVIFGTTNYAVPFPVDPISKAFEIYKVQFPSLNASWHFLISLVSDEFNQGGLLVWIVLDHNGIIYFIPVLYRIILAW